MKGKTGISIINMFKNILCRQNRDAEFLRKCEKQSSKHAVAIDLETIEEEIYEMI